MDNLEKAIQRTKRSIQGVFFTELGLSAGITDVFYTWNYHQTNLMGTLVK